MSPSVRKFARAAVARMVMETRILSISRARGCTRSGRSRGSLRERSLIERILRVYVGRADVRVGAAFAQADRETETDPVAHVLHVTRGVGLHPTPFITEAADRKSTRLNSS